MTGFEPFGGERINPSWEVAQCLEGMTVADAEVCVAQLPCVFSEALSELNRQLQLHQPQIVVALGQDDGRSD